VDNEDFENKENLGHGIKGEASNADTNLRNEKNSMNLSCDENFNDRE
jgi:hypothetical protein